MALVTVLEVRHGAGPDVAGGEEAGDQDHRPTVAGLGDGEGRMLPGGVPGDS